ncbi:MAG: hypothetical protein RBT22_06480 [Aliarcobacter sp.]|jgi:hypothetical protein|nr:hypothetical protein [Aliarcobacter sp.]
MASWWNKWKYDQENEQRVRDKLATLGTPCVIERNKIDNNTQINQDLNLAINNLDIELIKTLIQNGEDINKKYDDGNTPLINAVILNISDNLKIQNQKEIIELLLKIGADVYIKNKYNYNVLEIMTNKSHYDEIRKIFEKYNYFKNTKNENDKYLISLKESRIKKIDLSSSLDNLKNKLKYEQNNENFLIEKKEIHDDKLNNKEEIINLKNKENKYLKRIEFLEKNFEDLYAEIKIYMSKNYLIKNIEKDEENSLSPKDLIELKSTIEVQSKTIKNLEEYLQLQSKEINILKKDSKDKESKQAQQINELVSKIEKFDKIEVQSKIIKDLDNQLLLQSKEINNLKKEFENKQSIQTRYISELVKKIEKLEELSKKKPSSKSEKKPLIIPIQIENQTINKTDGELIKRDSFDDF